MTSARTSIVVVILVVIAIAFLYRKSLQPILFHDDNKLVTAIDSMREHDNQRDILYRQLQQLHTQDSIQIATIQDQLDDTQEMIDKINNRYAKQRTQLDNSPVDTRLQFLSNHLPKGSGSGR